MKAQRKLTLVEPEERLTRAEIMAQITQRPVSECEPRKLNPPQFDTSEEVRISFWNKGIIWNNLEKV